MTSRSLIMKKIILAGCVMLAVLPGCTTVDQNITLRYAQLDRTFGRQSAQIFVSRVDPVGSARNNRGEWIIGSLNNVHGVHQADLVSDRSLGEWISDALILELKHAGYAASQAPTLPAGTANGILISGIRSYLDADKGLVSVEVRHELKFNVDLFRNGIKAKSFTVASRDNQKLALDASREEKEQIMLLSLQDAMLRIMPEVITLTGTK